jgi:NAD(P)-dependent dehydrogenase (short-subunit alcohol dehydrogenase family)
MNSVVPVNKTTEPKPYDFSGRVALVCGSGAGGIGSSTSAILAECGAHVVAVDYSSALVEETRSQIERRGGKCLGIQADLRDPMQVGKILPTIRKELGRLDFVANIAGGTKKKQWMPLEKVTDQDFRDVMALNFDYVFQVCRDAGRFMIESRVSGGFVNVASVSAINSAPFHAAYGAAKRAVVAITETMAIEWGQYGIRANTVTPGVVRTPRTMASGQNLDDLTKTAPLQRPVEPQEVATTIAFLLSSNASGITGQEIVVDCGISKISVTGPLERFSAIQR